MSPALHVNDTNNHLHAEMAFMLHVCHDQNALQVTPRPRFTGAWSRHSPLNAGKSGLARQLVVLVTCAVEQQRDLHSLPSSLGPRFGDPDGNVRYGVAGCFSHWMGKFPRLDQAAPI